jgi:hypothetical protein
MANKGGEGEKGREVVMSALENWRMDGGPGDRRNDIVGTALTHSSSLRARPSSPPSRPVELPVPPPPLPVEPPLPPTPRPPRRRRRRPRRSPTTTW